MRAVRVHAYGKRPSVDEVAEPEPTGPLDVLVQVGAAGLCRTDLHIVEGQWAEKSGVKLPYTIGHENAGWVRAVGSAVTNVAPGDAVILHPLVTCGLCRPCRSGDDVHCENSAFPGIDTDGGMAEFLLTTARSCVRLRPGLEPRDVAALADAGLTAYHAVRKAVPLLYPAGFRWCRAGPRPRPVPAWPASACRRRWRAEPGGSRRRGPGSGDARDTRRRARRSSRRPAAPRSRPRRGPAGARPR